MHRARPRQKAKLQGTQADRQLPQEDHAVRGKLVPLEHREKVG